MNYSNHNADCHAYQGSRFFSGFSSGKECPNLVPVLKACNRLSLVVSLLLRSCPSTVARLVAKVVLQPINRTTGRARTHVGEKITEVQPAVANSDANAAVTRERRAFGVLAPLNHRVPRFIRWRPIHTMAQLFQSRLFITHTSAGTHQPAAQAIASSNSFLAAFASTAPGVNTPSLFACRLNNSQSPKHMPKYVFHGANSNAKDVVFLGKLKEHLRACYAHADAIEAQMGGGGGKPD